jgi:hypothetical protein
VKFSNEPGKVLILTAHKDLTADAVISENGSHLAYTTPIDIDTIDSRALSTTAHLIQEWVPKEYDSRVTIVCEQVFAVAIHASSQQGYIDWRSDYKSLKYRLIDPPCGVMAAAMRFLRHLGLSFQG